MSEYIDLSAITKRLKEVVDRSGLTSRDFAMKAGIAPATLSLNLNEKQQINVATINKIVEHFSDIMSPEEFVFESRETIVVVEDSYMGNSLLSTLSHLSL